MSTEPDSPAPTDRSQPAAPARSCPREKCPGELTFEANLDRIAPSAQYKCHKCGYAEAA